MAYHKFLAYHDFSWTRIKSQEHAPNLNEARQTAPAVGWPHLLHAGLWCENLGSPWHASHGGAVPQYNCTLGPRGKWLSDTVTAVIVPFYIDQSLVGATRYYRVAAEPRDTNSALQFAMTITVIFCCSYKLQGYLTGTGPNVGFGWLGHTAHLSIHGALSGWWSFS